MAERLEAKHKGGVLVSRKIDYAADDDPEEMCYQRGWSDGLPVTPPTDVRVLRMLKGTTRKPDEVIGKIPPYLAPCTIEKVAINAVMAGCKPEYMPVITATVEALADPLYGYHGPATSTGGSAVFMLVNGPIAKKLDINSGDNVFGQGWRANATIGRAIRLMMQNVIGTTPGVLDRSSLGHPGKYTFCIAENEEDSPWSAFHTTRGFKPEQNAVTIFAALGVHQYSNGLSATPEGVLTTACAQMRFSAGTNRQPQYAMVFAGEHQLIMQKAGWSREDVQNYVFEHSKMSQAEMQRANIRPGPITAETESTMQPLVQTPQDLLVIAAGGKAGVQSCYIPGWGSKNGSQSVTREIRVP